MESLILEQFDSPNKILSVSTVAKKCGIKRKHLLYDMNNMSQLTKVHPLEVGSGKTSLNIFKKIFWKSNKKQHMDDLNKKALKVLVEEGEHKFIEHVFKDPNNPEKKLSYG